MGRLFVSHLYDEITNVEYAINHNERRGRQGGFIVRNALIKHAHEDMNRKQPEEGFYE